MDDIESDDQLLIPKVEKHANFVTSINDDNPTIQHYGAIPDTKLLDLNEETSRCSRILEQLSTLTIEPFLFSYMLAFVLSMSCMTNMVMDKGCKHKFNYSDEICQNLQNDSYKTEKDAVDALGSDYSLYMKLLSPLGALNMAFMAPWSDKYGRKPPLLIALFGSIITDIGYILCAFYFDSGLEYLIVASVPGEILGGFICILAIVFSHASEISSSKKRTLKYTTVELSLGLSIVFGSLIGGLLFRYYGYVYVFVVSFAFHVTSLLWVIYVVPETRGLDSKVHWKKKFVDFFSFESVKDGIKAFTRVRENSGRVQLWTLLGSVCFIIITYEAFSSIGFLYAHHQFNWDAGTYNEINTIFGLLQMGCLILVIPILLKVFKVSDSMLGIIGSISNMTKNTLVAFAKNESYLWIFYLGNSVGFISYTAPLSVRSRISKLVEVDELARVFTFLAICEAVVPTFGTIILTRIFNATMDIVPSICYLTATGMLIVPLGTFIWQYRLSKTMEKQSVKQPQ